MCIFKIAIFEVDAPLKWHLSNQSLSQGLALQKRKKKLSGFTVQSLWFTESETRNRKGNLVITWKTNCVSHRWQISSYVQGQEETIQARANKKQSFILWCITGISQVSKLFKCITSIIACKNHEIIILLYEIHVLYTFTICKKDEKEDNQWKVPWSKRIK